MTPQFDVVFSLRVQGLRPNEGLFVLLSDLIKGLSRRGVRVRIFLADRHVNELKAVLTANGVPLSLCELIGFDVSPAVIKIWMWHVYRKERQGSSRNAIFSFLLKAFFPFRNAVIAVLSRSSFVGAILLLLVGMVPALAVGVPFAIAVTLIGGTGFLLSKLWKLLMSRSPLAKPRLRHVFGRLLSAFNKELMDAAFNVESRRLAAKINRRRDVSRLFSPFAFNGDLLSTVNKPKLVVFPDYVVGQFPSRYLGVISKQQKEQMRKSLACADAIICYSETLAERQLRVNFCEEARSKPVYVIPQGFFTTRDNREDCAGGIEFTNYFQPFCAFLPKYDIKELDYVVYPSVDRPHKNTGTLIRAIEHLIRKRHLNLKLITTSHWVSPDTTTLIEDKRLFLDCLFAPSLTDRELATLIRHARLIVHPSLAEGGDIFNFSRGIAAGVPVLMADIPMAREMFERYGVPESLFERWLFQPTNHLALAELIDRSLRARAELLEEQRAVLLKLQHYDFEAMAQKYYDAYLALGVPRMQ